MCFARGISSALTIFVLVVAAAAPALAEASLDIRPNTCPNLIDRYSQGIVTVALVSDLDFVAARVGINHSTLRMRRADGMGGSLQPAFFRRGPQYIDVSAPSVEGLCSISGPDGIRDLVLFFGQQRLVRNLHLRFLPPDQEITLCLTGETWGGTELEFCDDVIVTDFQLFAIDPFGDDDTALP
ncbi:MAG: hypothetical protein GTN89_02365 [Acidobacteria bacterium]|nr:hypothetical protein [Acidobacteriota bacterium]NIM61803.1 hypothetical protein [Acidobacteriota bacterium]NIO58214.1 hypothetical protein [Acidobacteriota bacterium]NIQ29231.1 hypothetical protein [Acidobacteriota bacterium]NIQ83808.1 hypothetical protein [Acidobacteriota bacterium]